MKYNSIFIRLEKVIKTVDVVYSGKGNNVLYTAGVTVITTFLGKAFSVKILKRAHALIQKLHFEESIQ